MALIQAENIQLSTPQGEFLTQPFSFTLEARQLLLITGQNGVGKSTLIKGLMGAERVLHGLCKIEVKPEAIAYLPQQQNVAFHLPLTLRELIEIAHGYRSLEKIPDEFQLLASHQWNLRWNTASGGERKRALLMRALLYHPQLLILDEPYNHLDKESSRKISQALRAFLETAHDRSLIMVTHEEQYLDEFDRSALQTLSLDRVRCQR